jgi:hypothetical protein
MNTPKFLHLKLNENNAQADLSSNEGFGIRTESGRIIGQIKYPRNQKVFAHDDPSKITKPDWAVQHSLNAICAFDSAMLRINKDGRFTKDGKREQLIPVSQSAIKTLAAVDRELRNYAADVKNWGFHHYAVPEFNPADMMGFLREQEVRTWITSLGDKAVAKLAAPLLSGTNPYVSLAILRSPIPFDGLQDKAQEGWRVVRDKADPETAQKIGSATELIDWAAPWVNITAGLVHRSSLEILPEFESLVPQDARELFGLDSSSREAA